MRLLRHLTESSNEADSAWRLVQKKCKPFLKEWLPIFKSDTSRARFLYRGMFGSYNEYGEKRVRKNRTPIDSGEDLHKELDDLFKQKFGIRGRSQAVFVTGDHKQTLPFGYPYIIFPVGKYRYLWSNKIRDITVDIKKKGYLTQKDIGVLVMFDPTYRTAPEEDKEEIKRELKKMYQHRSYQAVQWLEKVYRTTNLKEAIKSGHEIMIECDSYIYIKDNWDSDLEDIIRGEGK